MKSPREVAHEFFDYSSLCRYGQPPGTHTAECERLTATIEADRANVRLALRPQVAAFAQLMEQKLRENDHKGGWWHDGTDALMKRLRQETDELGDLTEMSGAWCSAPPSAALDDAARRAIGREAADVANFAMMIADVCGALLAARTTKETP